MTTPSVACAANGSAVRRPHPHGFDRAIMRVGLALLLWARRRAERRAELHARLIPLKLTRRPRQLRLSQQRALVQREREWALRAHRVTR